MASDPRLRRYHDDEGLPSLEAYEKEFRQRFGREMTAEERRFYQLTLEMLRNEEHDSDEVA